MKNVFKILFLSIPLCIFSQDNTKTILTSLRDNREIETCFKNPRKFKIGVDDFSKLKKGSSFELFDQNNRSINNLCLLKINSINDYDLFTVISKEILVKPEKNTAQANAFGYFLLYNRTLNKMLCIESTSGGTVAHRTNKKITFLFDIENLRQKVYLINNSLMPISGLYCFETDMGEKKYSLSVFEANSNGFNEKIVLKNYSHSSAYLIPFSELMTLLDSKPLKFDKEKECFNENCYSEITQIVLKK